MLFLFNLIFKDFPGDDRRGFQQQQQQQRDFFQNISNMNVAVNMGGNMGSLGNNMNNMGRTPPQNLNRNVATSLRSPFGPRLGPMFVRGPSRPGPPGR